MADELAWECYEPVRKHAPKLKEPPLVFLGPSAEPFSIARGADYATRTDRETDGHPPPGRATPPGPGHRRPVVPHLRHLPDALVIAHEVGHLAETDLNLTPTLDRLIRGAGPDWKRWLGEVFADVYATLATGPGYLSALAGLPRHRFWRNGRGSLPATGKTPQLGQSGPGRRRHDGGRPGGISLVKGPYPELEGRSLDEILTFDHDLADRQATALLLRMAPDARSNVRTLLSSAALAFARDPETYQKSKSPTAC